MVLVSSFDNPLGLFTPIYKLISEFSSQSTEIFKALIDVLQKILPFFQTVLSTGDELFPFVLQVGIVLTVTIYVIRFILFK